jgi:hypothetical protein
MWKVTGASVAGTTHEAAGRACDDASAWSAEADVTCLAVADGAGSRPLSGLGSALAVERAVSIASACAREPGASDPAAWLRMVFSDVREQLGALASGQNRVPDDYATTLAIVILTRDLVCIGQVGDAIVVAGREGAYETVAPSPRTEYVNETSFVTEDRALDLARLTILPAAGIDSVFLSTDGLRYKILDDLATAAPFAPFFDDVAAYLRSPDATADAVQRFLAGLTDDQSGDDKTLVAAARIRPDDIQHTRQPGGQTTEPVATDQAAAERAATAPAGRA